MKVIILYKDEPVDYQTLIEEIIGMEISKLKCYHANFDRKSNIKGFEVEKDRAHFIPDADYEMIIRKKRIDQTE